MFADEDFPRGGKKVIKNPLKRERPNDQLFPTEKKHKSKKRRKDSTKNNESLSEDRFLLSLSVKGTLTYRTVQDDMIILACIKSITQFSLGLEFPGLINGRVTLKNISEPMTEYLTKTLSNTNEVSDFSLENVFKCGQFVPAKVLGVETTEERTFVNATINPEDINSEKRHDSLTKGMLVWACVKSKLDHGYELSVGIKNCRVFLHNKNVDANVSYAVGQTLFCVVHKQESTPAATTLKVSAKREHINACKVEELNTLHEALPGMQVELATEKITDTGIQGKFLENYFGYIHESQLRKPLQTVQNYKEGKLLSAHILYVEPTTKITHLTLRNLDTIEPPIYSEGDVLPGEVFSKTSNGIFLKLSDTEKGFVSNKRLIKSLPGNAPTDVQDAVKSKFPIGSTHTCKVFGYSGITRCYICTTEPHVLKQNLFVKQEAKLGQVVKVTITEVKPEGLVVTAGRVSGFVPNLHISNVEYSDKIKKKYTVGTKAVARICSIKKGNILFTLKQGLVESNNCLTSIEDAEIGKKYSGFVASIYDTAVTVCFFGDVKGTIGIDQLVCGETGQSVKPREYFYRGQIVNPWVIDKKESKLILSLKGPTKDTKDKKKVINIGTCVSGIVTQVHKDRLELTVRKNIRGVIPLNHLSVSQNLCRKFLDVFKPGDKIDTVMCIDNEQRPVVFSRREGLAVEKSEFKIKKFKALRRGNLVRCFVVSCSENGIHVRPLIVDYVQDLFIPNKNIISQDHPIPKFHKDQPLVAKILRIYFDKNELLLGIKLSQVFDKSVESAIDYFQQQMVDLEYLRVYGSENEWKICEYDVGERVDCTVVKTKDTGGCAVKLPNDVMGLVTAYLCPADVKVGQVLKGVVLSQDFDQNFLEICLNKDMMSKINNVQNGKVGLKTETSKAQKILVNNNFVLCVLTTNRGKKQLVYLPKKVHENDVNDSCMPFYNESTFKVCLSGKVGSTIIGFSKQQRDVFDYHKRLLESKNANTKSEKVNGMNDHDSSEEDVTSDDEVDVEDEDENGSDEEMEQEEDEHSYEEMESDDEIDLEDEEQSDEDESDGILGDEVSDEQESEEEENDNVANQNGVDGEISDEQESEDGNQDENGLDDEESDEEETPEKLNENGLDDEDDSDEEMEIDNKNANLNKVDDNSDEEEDSGELEDVKMSSIIQVAKPTINSTSSPQAVLPGVTSFLNPKLSNPPEEESSSDDEEEEEEKTKKKKKLTPAERAELARQEEERIAKIEKELADNSVAPQSADQFDRLLLANPNSSELWMKYISFHVSSTELEKARAVAKRALEAIDITLTQEKFNIWIAMLNLECMYGTKDSFEDTFQEAVRCNDSLQIYLKTIEVLAEAGKLNEMEEKVKKVRSKYKQEPTMWLEVAKVYFFIKKFKDARNIKDAALKSIEDKKTQMNLIVRFAIMEFKFGEEEHGKSVFETILANDPRKVNVWITYVDQLVKKEHIEQARKVLERAVSQKLPLKSMKSLFMKFRMFEEQHGTPDSVEEVKKRAQDFITKIEN